MTPPNLSLILVMGCFWVTMWIVYRYLIRPVGTTVDERSRRINDAQQEWSARNEEHLAAIVQVENEVADAAREAAQIRTAARQKALDARQELLDGARESADTRLSGALEELDRQAVGASNELRRRAEDLARILAGRLIEREVGR
jgi:F0F1-type ATP synthase membrane subunit b/b'